MMGEMPEPTDAMHDALARRAQRVLGGKAPPKTAAKAGDKKPPAPPATVPPSINPAIMAPVAVAPLTESLAVSASFSELATQALRTYAPQDGPVAGKSVNTLNREIFGYYQTSTAQSPDRAVAETVFRSMYDQHNLFILQEPTLISAWAMANHLNPVQGQSFWSFLDHDVRQELRLSGNDGLFGYFKAVGQQCKQGPLGRVLHRFLG